MIAISVELVGFYCANRKLYIGKVGRLPVVGTITNNVRPITRKTITKPSGLGAIVPILRWANSIGNNWVNETVRSYRKGVK